MEFPHPDKPPARTGLIAQLDLNLIEHLGQVTVALDIAGGQLGNHLFVGGAQDHLALAAVVEGKEHVHLVPPALLPYLERLYYRHIDFLAAGPVHFLANDILYFTQHPPAKRQVGINTGSELINHAGLHQQPVAGRIRIGGNLS